MSKTILLAGATGLVGSACLPLLLADDRVGKVIALVRRPLPNDHTKLVQWVGDDLLKALKAMPVDAVICCLGTTIKKAGSQAAFIAVDKDLPVGIGRWAKSQGVPVFCTISAIGADSRSQIFYSRVKGVVEDELDAMGFESLSLFRPSVLSGPRQERRFAEGLAIAVMKIAAPLFIGPLRNYRTMRHDVLAKALVEAALLPRKGTHRYAYNDIRRLADI